MKNIKFRAWDKRNKEMIFDIFRVSEFGTPILITFPPYLSYPLVTPDLIWLQFTGLLDKNGKEIYEGDIVKGEFGIDQIHFYEGEFRKKSGEQPGCSIGRLGSKTVEIIGNIYESKRLLDNTDTKT